MQLIFNYMILLVQILLFSITLFTKYNLRSFKDCQKERSVLCPDIKPVLLWMYCPSNFCGGSVVVRRLDLLFLDVHCHYYIRSIFEASKTLRATKNNWKTFQNLCNSHISFMFLVDLHSFDLKYQHKIPIWYNRF